MGADREPVSNGGYTSANPQESHPGPKALTILEPTVRQQIRQLLDQGCRIGLEYVDQRRFRTNSWQTIALENSRQETAVIAALETLMQQQPQDYIRLVGIVPQSRQRVVETIIQRPQN